MSGSDIPPEEQGLDDQSESVNAPERDTAPPQRRRSDFVWVALILLVALMVSGLVVGVWVGVVSG